MDNNISKDVYDGIDKLLAIPSFDSKMKLIYRIVDSFSYDERITAHGHLLNVCDKYTEAALREVFNG